MSDRITVIGNVASQPERRELPGGIPAISFRLASSERRLENGQWVDSHTNWYWVSAYRKLADHALASLEKGQRVIVTGRFRVKQWESGGKSGSSAEIDADGLGHDLMFGTTSFQKGTTPSASATVAQSTGWAVPGDGPSDIPQSTDASSDAASSPEEPDVALVSASGWATAGEDTTPF
ncbi:MAG: single-stranded DNA-binding protein [Microbacterium sp. 69-7]|uniref:Single-stranded DNA-binding protein n=1 Tax=Microbacterium laevaniformans TaxID=36807 RepID=A0A150HDY0_9MICO|nr:MULTISPECIES: single-stranded DNA-binding protein [Microbacterium]KXZ60225.1 Single-stranded DNA-binding protein 1 [Microbacterium laevaniformans]OJU46408.1 MAG: single-stranded DNA-binding protein [Microbacterium sp. 69-7]